MKRYICEDVAMVLGEMEQKLKALLNDAQESHDLALVNNTREFISGKINGLQEAYDLLKQTQDDWQSEELDLI